MSPVNNDRHDGGEREDFKEQEQCTAKLVISAFNRLLNKEQDGVRATDITQYLQNKFGNVWREDVLTIKAEQTLNRGAVLGFLEQQDDKYKANLSREVSRRRSKRQRRSIRRRCGTRRTRRRLSPRLFSRRKK